MSSKPICSATLLLAAVVTVLAIVQTATAQTLRTKTCADLHDAVFFDNNLTTIKHLIEVKKCSVNLRRKSDRYTPLHVAVDRSGLKGLSHPYDPVQVEIIKYLLKKGANVRDPFPSFAGITGYTPLHYMSFDSNIGLVQLFVQYGANVNARDQRGFTPLHSAARCDFRISCDACAVNTITYLMSKGGNILARTKANETVLDIVPDPCQPAKGSCTSYDPRAKQCGDLCTAKGKNWTWPSGTCKKLYFFVKEKMAAASNKAKACKDLHEAILFNNTLTTIKNLIEVKKCDVNLKRASDGWSPLHVALERSGKNGLSHPYEAFQVTLIQYLLKKGANVKTPFPKFADITGYTPLHFVAYDGNMILVPLFIKYGASIKARDQRGFTPLHAAARCDFRLSCDDCTPPKSTPPKLRTARLSKAGARPTIAYLLSKGGDILAKTKANETVLDIVPTPCLPPKASCTFYDPRAKQCGDYCTAKGKNWTWPSGTCQKTYLYVKAKTAAAKKALAKTKPN